MAFDPGKIQENNRLAKKLVEQRLAANMEDALKQISGHDEIKEEEVVISPKDEDDPEAKAEEKEEVAKVEQNTVSNDKIVELENKIKKLNDFLNQFKDVVNKNFRELDEKVSSLKNAKAAAPAQSQAQQSSKGTGFSQRKETAQKADPDNFTEDQFAVETFFSNSGNRMDRKR